MSKAFFTFMNPKTMTRFIQHFLEQIPKSVVFLSFWDMLTKRSIKNMKRVERKEYLDKLKVFKDKQLIKEKN